MPNPAKADLEQRLSVLLAELGADADAVAAALKGWGVRGVRNMVRFLNPIVIELKTRVRVDAWTLDVMQGDKVRLAVPGVKAQAPLPQPVLDFLTSFNPGGYPELELPPEES